MGNLGGTAVVSPGAPGGGVGLADVVREIPDAGAGSGDHTLEKFEQCFLSSEKRREEKRWRERETGQKGGVSPI